MKILYVLADDILSNTSANIRNAALIRGLLDNNHSVDVVCYRKCATPDAGQSRAIEGCKLVYLRVLVTQRGNVASTPKTSKIRKTVKHFAVKAYNLFRIYDPFYSGINRVKVDLKEFDQPEIVISSSDPRSSHVLALRIIEGLNFQGRYVQYWGDPMMNDISSSALMKPFLHVAERKLLMRADLIVYTNRTICTHINQEYGIPRDKITSIPSSIVRDVSLNADNLTGESEVERDDQRGNLRVIEVGYFGDYYQKTRNILPLIEAVDKSSNIRLTIAGGTDFYIKETQRVKQYGKLSITDTSLLQDQMDILVVLENIPRNIRGKACYQVPGKVYHYALLTKKILVITENTLIKQEFSDTGRYMFCENNPTSILDAIHELSISKDQKLTRPCSQFSPAEVAKTLISKCLMIK